MIVKQHGLKAADFTLAPTKEMLEQQSSMRRKRNWVKERDTRAIATPDELHTERREHSLLHRPQ